MPHHDALFAAAADGDLTHLLELLKGVRDPAAVRARTGESLLLHLLYRGKGEAAAAVAATLPALGLHEAAALGRTDRVRQVLAGWPGAADTLSGDGWTPLHLAAFFNQSTCLRVLLEAGADPDLRGLSPVRNLPLHAACAGRNTDCALLLVPVTAEVDDRQAGGVTALMLAAANGMEAVVDALLDRGATPGLTDDSGKTAADHALARGHAALAGRL